MQTKVQTVGEIIGQKRNWIEMHEPYDRVGRLPNFQYVVEGTGGALVPLSTGVEEVNRLPQLTFEQRSLNQLLQRVEYPNKLYDRLPKQLNILNLNWLIQNGAYDKEVLFRIYDEHKVRALMSSKFQPLDDLELLELVAPYCNEGVVRWWADNELATHVSVSFPNYGVEIRKGDVVEHGIHISNSEVGARSVVIASYVYRLRCLNGQIGGGDEDFFRFRHIGNKNRFQQAVSSAVESAMLGAFRITAQFQDALKKQIDKPFELIESISKNENLTVEQYKATLDAYLNEGGGTLFDVSQSFSTAAHNFDGDESFALQRVAVRSLSEVV